MEINKGKIKDFLGSWGSGLGYLMIEDSESGTITQVPCENASTVRALQSCFSNVITDGHTANGSGYKDKEIFWSYDEMGLMFDEFIPVEDASVEVIEQYEKQQQENSGQQKLFVETGG